MVLTLIVQQFIVIENDLTFQREIQNNTTLYIGVFYGLEFHYIFQKLIQRDFYLQTVVFLAIPHRIFT